MVKKCLTIAEVRGVEALRMSYLYYGPDKEERENSDDDFLELWSEYVPDDEPEALDIPHLSAFVENYYKKYDVPKLSTDRINKIILTNSCSQVKGDKISKALFCFKSLFNHNENKISTYEKYLTPSLVFIYASEDIEEGQEINTAHVEGIQDLST